MLSILFLSFCWISSGILAMRVMNWLDGDRNDWKSDAIGAASGPAGMVVVSMWAVLYLLLKIFDSVCNLIRKENDDGKK